ncbi:N-6 DNA methylase [Flaviflexus huanghaiensis]|uniref:N-6 DNA methylase n=1 Tax=Flaviflexus huanghaiensis TaxID=1111473 RepID=UPI0015F7F497|nr:N-6 DNA methylase [Flaviflexus huanghaiensis]
MSDQLLSPTNIAELASVSRSVVSNWRKRYDDFPEPVGGTDSRPLFSRDEIISWLTARDYTVTEDTVATIWASLNVLRGILEADSAQILVLLLFGIRQYLPDEFDEIAGAHRNERLSLLDAAEAELRSHYPTDEKNRVALRVDLADLLTGISPASVDPLLTAIGSAEVGRIADYADEIIARFSRTDRFGNVHGSVGSSSSALLAALLRDVEGTVYDPASGIADALVLVAAHHRATSLIGSEISPRALIVACLRTMLSGVNVSFTLGDVLAEDPVPDLVADAVIVEPPLGVRVDPTDMLADPRFSYGISSSMGSELLWIQHALAHLAPEGRAYVLTSHAVLRRGRREKDIRANLLTAGCVEAIVSLPSRTLSYTATPPALWVLRNPGPARSVLFIDARDVTEPRDVVPSWLSEGRIDAPHARIDITTLLADGSDLTPAPWTGFDDVDPTLVKKAAIDTAAALSATLESLAASQLPPIALDGLPKPQITTVGKLLDVGVVERVPNRAGRTAKTDPSVVRHQHLRDQALPTQCENPALNSTDETKPGDVLLTTVHGIFAMVDWGGDRRVSLGVEHLRVTDRSALAPDYLAFALTGTWNERFRVESAMSRITLEDMEIPMIPLSDQEEVGQLLSRIGEIQNQARHIVQLGDEARSGILDAVRHHIDIS